MHRLRRTKRRSPNKDSFFSHAKFAISLMKKRKEAISNDFIYDFINSNGIDDHNSNLCIRYRDGYRDSHICRFDRMHILTVYANQTRYS